MKLTKGEYCQFNLKSRITLLKGRGKLLFRKKLDNIYEIMLFRIYDFYVEVFYNYKTRKILTADPILNVNWLDFYLKDINLNSLL